MGGSRVAMLAAIAVSSHAWVQSTSSALHAPGRAYLLARALGTPASLALLALQGAFRGARDTATPLLAALVGTGLNLILDPLLIGARLNLQVDGIIPILARRPFSTR